MHLNTEKYADLKNDCITLLNNLNKDKNIIIDSNFEEEFYHILVFLFSDGDFLAFSNILKTNFGNAIEKLQIQQYLFNFCMQYHSKGQLFFNYILLNPYMIAAVDRLNFLNRNKRKYIPRKKENEEFLDYIRLYTEEISYTKELFSDKNYSDLIPAEKARIETLYFFLFEPAIDFNTRQILFKNIEDPLLQNTSLLNISLEYIEYRPLFYIYLSELLFSSFNDKKMMVLFDSDFVSGLLSNNKNEKNLMTTFIELKCHLLSSFFNLIIRKGILDLAWEHKKNVDEILLLKKFFSTFLSLEHVFSDEKSFIEFGNFLKTELETTPERMLFFILYFFDIPLQKNKWLEKCLDDYIFFNEDLFNTEKLLTNYNDKEKKKFYTLLFERFIKKLTQKQDFNEYSMFLNINNISLNENIKKNLNSSFILLFDNLLKHNDPLLFEIVFSTKIENYSNIFEILKKHHEIQLKKEIPNNELAFQEFINHSPSLQIKNNIFLGVSNLFLNMKNKNNNQMNDLQLYFRVIFESTFFYSEKANKFLFIELLNAFNQNFSYTIKIIKPLTRALKITKTSKNYPRMSQFYNQILQNQNKYFLPFLNEILKNDNFLSEKITQIFNSMNSSKNKSIIDLLNFLNINQDDCKFINPKSIQKLYTRLIMNFFMQEEFLYENSDISLIIHKLTMHDMKFLNKNAGILSQCKNAYDYLNAKSEEFSSFFLYCYMTEIKQILINDASDDNIKNINNKQHISNSNTLLLCLVFLLIKHADKIKISSDFLSNQCLRETYFKDNSRIISFFTSLKDEVNTRHVLKNILPSDVNWTIQTEKKYLSNLLLITVLIINKILQAMDDSKKNENLLLTLKETINSQIQSICWDDPDLTNKILLFSKGTLIRQLNPFFIKKIPLFFKEKTEFEKIQPAMAEGVQSLLNAIDKIDKIVLAEQDISKAFRF